MSLNQIARVLRRDQTAEEKTLWRALRGRRFAGFKFRRQHTVGDHILDFYCATAKLAVELDGFQHGHPDGLRRDAAREKYLMEQGIATLRFWNHQWRENREGCLLEIWNAVQERSGCARVAECRGAALHPVGSQAGQAALRHETPHPGNDSLAPARSALRACAAGEF